MFRAAPSPKSAFRLSILFLILRQEKKRKNVLRIENAERERERVGGRDSIMLAFFGRVVWGRCSEKASCSSLEERDKSRWFTKKRMYQNAKETNEHTHPSRWSISFSRIIRYVSLARKKLSDEATMAEAKFFMPSGHVYELWILFFKKTKQHNKVERSKENWRNFRYIPRGDVHKLWMGIAGDVRWIVRGKAMGKNIKDAIKPEPICCEI